MTQVSASEDSSPPWFERSLRTGVASTDLSWNAVCWNRWGPGQGQLALPILVLLPSHVPQPCLPPGSRSPLSQCLFQSVKAESRCHLMDRPQRRSEMRSHCGSWGLPRNNVCRAWCHSEERGPAGSQWAERFGSPACGFGSGD